MEKDKIIKFEKREKVKEVAKSNIDEKVQNGSIVSDNDTKTYKNNYFGLEIQVPENWITLDNNELLKMAQLNINKLNISETEKNKILESITYNTVSLFRATPYPSGEKQPYGKNKTIDNPSINCTAQKVIMYPNSTSTDFVKVMVENFKNGYSGIKYDSVSEIIPVIISGKRFDTFEGKVAINNGRDIVRTKYYSILKKGYQLSIIATCISEEGYEDLCRIIYDLKLD